MSTIIHAGRGRSGSRIPPPRLPNGNTLIVGTYGARAFEVTREREVVREYVSPHRAPDEPSFAARLHDVTRLPEGFGAGWLGDPDSR